MGGDVPRRRNWRVGDIDVDLPGQIRHRPEELVLNDRQRRCRSESGRAVRITENGHGCGGAELFVNSKMQLSPIGELEVVIESDDG